MGIDIQVVQRVFCYSGMQLPDPGTQLTPRAVRDLYSAQYPELTTAEVEVGDVVDGRQEITFRRMVGTKGAA